MENFHTEHITRGGRRFAVIVSTKAGRSKEDLTTVI